MTRYLAVDPGEQHIGLAVSDPTGTVARPLEQIRHQSRTVDAALVAQIAREQEAEGIVVGLATDSEGKVGPQGRKALRFADALREQTDLPVEMWDETGTSQLAQQRQIQMNMRSKKRKGLLDSMAAVAILQGYLEYRRQMRDGLQEGADES